MWDGQAARISTEWRRWEEADKWSWDADKRRRWAERLWRGQVMRHGARMRARVEAAASAARQRVDVRHRTLCLIARTKGLVFGSLALFGCHSMCQHADVCGRVLLHAYGWQHRRLLWEYADVRRSLGVSCCLIVTPRERVYVCVCSVRKRQRRGGLNSGITAATVRIGRQARLCFHFHPVSLH